MKATNQSIQRSFNRSLVLQKVRSEGRISRVDLARSVGLEKSSITAIVGELVDRGLLVETEAEAGAPAAVGRKPVFLRLQTAYCCFLGVEIQPTRYQAVVLDLGGRVVHQESGRLEAGRTFDEKLADLYRRLTPAVEAAGLPLAAVGIGVPGLVDPPGGTVRLSVPHGLEDWSPTAVANPWGVPVFLENDANCCAWTTLLDGDPTDGGDFLALLLEFQDPNPRLGQDSGVSLGLGVVLGGEVHYGRHFEAGEFRSVFWRKGRRSQTGIDDRDLEAIARDPAVLDRYLEEVLLNLIPICSLLSPQRVLLCGEAGRAYPRIQALIEGPLASTWLAASGLGQRLAPSPRGVEAVAVGAAARMIMTLFNSRSLAKSAQPPGLDWDTLLARFGRPGGR